MSLTLPPPREYGWELKPLSSCYSDVSERPNGQLNVVLHHALLRGCTSEMIHWWFQHFGNLEVRLDDVEGYEGKKVPAYYLWHPHDHVGATYLGELGPGNTLQSGAKIHIREAIYSQKYGTRFAVDNVMEVPYLAPGAMTLHKRLPLLGDLVMGRIHYRDIVEGGEILGVQYHYEFVAGRSDSGLVTKLVHKKLKSRLGQEFFEAWLTHNVIEVGAFENFLPALYAQRDDLDQLHYSKSMNPDLPSPSEQSGHSKALFEERVRGYKEADDPFEYMGATSPRIL